MHCLCELAKLKELCGNDLLGLKLVISILKIKNARALTDEDQIKTLIENNSRYTTQIS